MSADAFVPSPGFKGLWVPACILFDPELPLIRKIILAEVFQLQQNDDRECFAGNAHFCALTGCKERNLRNHLLALENTGLLWRYTPGKRRKLAVCRALEQAIEKDSQEPISRTIRQQSAASKPHTDAHNRQSATGQAANIDSTAAPVCRATRQLAATENTGREQHKNTEKRTTASGIFLDFDASTHHLNEHGKPIVSKHAWKRWRNMQARVWDDSPTNSKKQLAILNRMVGLGFDSEALIRDCTARRECTFWEMPPEHHIPGHLVQRDSFDRDERGVYVV